MANAADSIGDAVRVKLGTVLPGTWTVSRKKKMILPDAQDMPTAVVVIGEEGERERVCAGPTPLDMQVFPVQVGLFMAGGELLADAVPLRDIREDVQDAVNTPSTYAAVDGLNEVWGGGRVPFSLGGLTANVDFSVLSARVQVLVPRSY